MSRVSNITKFILPAVAIATATLGALALPTAQAHADSFNVSLGLGNAYPVGGYSTYYQPAPVYYRPAPVYYRPVPVYRPAPVYVNYNDGWRGNNGWHRGWDGPRRHGWDGPRDGGWNHGPRGGWDGGPRGGGWHR